MHKHLRRNLQVNQWTSTCERLRPGLSCCGPTTSSLAFGFMHLCPSKNRKKHRLLNDATFLGFNLCQWQTGKSETKREAPLHQIASTAMTWRCVCIQMCVRAKLAQASCSTPHVLIATWPIYSLLVINTKRTHIPGALAGPKVRSTCVLHRNWRQADGAEMQQFCPNAFAHAEV